MKRDNFYDILDELIDKAADGMKARVRTQTASEVFDEIEAEGDYSAAPMMLPKAALCVALQCEVNQWRPLNNMRSALEQRLKNYL